MQGRKGSARHAVTAERLAPWHALLLLRPPARYCRRRRRIGPLNDSGSTAWPFWQMSIVPSRARRLAASLVASMSGLQSLGRSLRGTSLGQHVAPAFRAARSSRIAAASCSQLGGLFALCASVVLSLDWSVPGLTAAAWRLAPAPVGRTEALTPSTSRCLRCRWKVQKTFRAARSHAASSLAVGHAQHIASESGLSVPLHE